MKSKRAPVEVFSLSFLDVISCAFGAVVMLILLAKNGEDGDFNDVSQISSLIQSLTRAEARVSNLQSAIAEQDTLIAKAQAQSASNAAEAENLEARVARAQRDVASLSDKASGLEQVKEQRERAAISVNDTEERSDEVGGIPVDADYVIFIVDTSGSMKAMWQKVLQTMDEVLNNHPQVKGFQIISDNGEFLVNTTRGQWRSDTPGTRRAMLAAMRNWGGSSNSSPVEGIETALRLYGPRFNSLALYVLGDDYSGGSYDETLARINQLNTNNQGKKIARIHAIGFTRSQGQLTADLVKFSTLMREVSQQNNGTFIAQ
uniref:VWA domain-containing protein n=1 Tax=Ningiella ruwaisensis TaxID=2364274 RepID=UPI0010A05117|nr:VWA domain-containing protein [Ningiella ruwaisensis]